MSPWKAFELGYWLETTALNNFSPQRLRRVHTSAALVLERIQVQPWAACSRWRRVRGEHQEGRSCSKLQVPATTKRNPALGVYWNIEIFTIGSYSFDPYMYVCSHYFFFEILLSFFSTLPLLWPSQRIVAFGFATFCHQEYVKLEATQTSSY